MDGDLALVPSWMAKKGHWLRGENEPESDWYDDNAQGLLSDETREQLWRQSQAYPSRLLDAGLKEIRLLLVLPGLWEDDIHGRLCIVRLGDGPQYEALSYTWGHASEQKKIFLEGLGHFAVTNNAFCALRRFRYTDRPRALWIDAICICQPRLQERQQQVSMMGEIYKRASRCLVWLGEFNGASTTITDLDTINSRPRDKLDDAGLLEALDFVYWHAQPRWWERAWVVQEVGLSREVLVCFGSFQIPWGRFCWDLMRVSSSESADRAGMESYPMQVAGSDAFPVRQSMFECFDVLSSVRHYCRNNAEPDAEFNHIRVMMERTRHAACSDYRDRVYSILSLIHPQEAALIPPVYNIPWVEVYARATYASIAVQGNFDIWLHLPDSPTFRPRWAIDFTRPVGGSLESMRNIGPDKWERWQDDEGQAPLVSLSGNAALLTVTGYTLDTISYTKLLPNYGNDGHHHDSTDEIDAILNAAVTDKRVAQAYGNLPRVDSNGMQVKTDSVLSTSASLSINPPPTPHEEGEAETVQAIPNSERPTKLVRTTGNALKQAFNLWSERAGVPAGLNDHGVHHGAVTWDVERFWRYADAVSGGPKFFTTAAGFIGLATFTVSKDDAVVLLDGSKLPVVLWYKGGDIYELRGFAYVHGIMYDELKKLGRCTGLKRESFVLM